MSAILCFYHAPCNDGASAAAALAYRLRKSRPDCEIELHPMNFTVQWEDPLPEEYMERFDGHGGDVSEIYIVDISLSPTKVTQILDHLRQHGRLGPEKPFIACIDHHRTAVDNLGILNEYCDETMIEIGPGLSGATLVWKYWDGKLGEEPMPLLLRYVADQDVWEWKLENSKAINFALNTLDGHADSMIEELERSMQDSDGWMAERLAQGRAILSVINAQLQKSFSRVLNLERGDNVELRVVNATENASELGNLLCEESHYTPNVVALIYSVQRDWSVKCSLRSVPGGILTARDIAERFGGGGHDHAAGCRFRSLDEFQEALSGLHQEEVSAQR